MPDLAAPRAQASARARTGRTRCAAGRTSRTSSASGASRARRSTPSTPRSTWTSSKVGRRLPGNLRPRLCTMSSVCTAGSGQGGSEVDVWPELIAEGRGVQGGAANGLERPLFACSPEEQAAGMVVIRGCDRQQGCNDKGNEACGVDGLSGG